MSVLFGAVFSSVLLDSGASHNFIAAPRIIKFRNGVEKSLLYPSEPIGVHLSDNYAAISHHIVHFPLKFADDTVHTIEFWVFLH